MRCIISMLVLLFLSGIATGEKISVLEADCCPSDLETLIYNVRCPHSQLNTECAPDGCCVYSNETIQAAGPEVVISYDCFDSTIKIESSRVCDEVKDCPRGDDELYCHPYNCFTSTYTSPSAQINAPCPGEDTCFKPSGSCQSDNRCPNVDDQTQDLCEMQTCPGSCICDFGSVYCTGAMDLPQQSSQGVALLDPRTRIFTIVRFAGSLILRNRSMDAYNRDGNAFILDPSDTPYLSTLVLAAPNPVDTPFDVVIEPGVFQRNPYLVTLIVRGSRLANITNGTLEGLSHLIYLNLDFNGISHITSGVFSQLAYLEILSISHNRIEYLEIGAFDGLTNLRSLSLAENNIYLIQAGTFLPLIQVRTIFLTGAELIELPSDVFEGLEGLSAFHVTDFRLCCRVSNLGECINYEPTRFSSCSGGLLQYRSLSVFMWILGFSALLGNAFVLIMRLRERHGGSQKAHIQTILITNLAAADFLTGVYMITLASADAFYGANYFVYANMWRQGPSCKVIGVIALLSSEASVLIISLISIDRFLSVVFPFSRFHLTVKSVKIFAAAIWLLSSMIAIVPPIVASRISQRNSFYVYPDVCLGLPLIRDTDVEFIIEDYDLETQGLDYSFSYSSTGEYPYYAIAVFIGLNFICFLAIVVSYVAIFIYARRSAKKAKRVPDRDQELRLAARMAVIVGTDCCCWMPIIIMGVLAQSGLIQIPTSLYAWSVVFILPINSAINPHLYTFGTMRAGTCRKGGLLKSDKVKSSNTTSLDRNSRDTIL